MNGYIYMITEKATGMIYIGQTRNISHRKAQYRYMTKNGDPTKKKQREFVTKLIGKDFDNDFEFTILESNISDQDILNKREIYWIKKFNSTNPTIGYNIYPGGCSIGFIDDVIRNTWKMQSKKKRGVIAYDTIKNRCILCMSCASAAAVFDFKSATCLATNVRKLRRIKSQRYFLYYSNINYEIDLIKTVAKKRIKTINNIKTNTQDRIRNARIIKISKYMISALRGYIEVLDFMGEMSGKDYKNARKVIDDLIHIFELEISKIQ